jgi:TPR repeat protein
LIATATHPLRDALAGLLLASLFALPVAHAQELDAVREAANQGDPAAQTLLAGALYRGEGVARDPAAAFAWFRRAAEQGEVSAQRALSVLYYNGEGTPQHLVEALKWALLAAAQGDAEAARHRDYLRDRLAPFQVREAERLAATWQATPE